MMDRQQQEQQQEQPQQEQPRQFRTSPASRERNRVHAQRTRQRKKEQMMILQNRAAELKEEQIGLKQTINEKSTATILVDMFALGQQTLIEDKKDEDPMVEALLKRPVSEIPDASQIPELPALILPGQHASKKIKAQSSSGLPNTGCSGNSDSRHGPVKDTCHVADATTEHFQLDDSLLKNTNLLLDDGIDYELLGRDRSQCSPEELDRIRRERNRMHAKRTRDRKRLFTEQLAAMCRQLEDENLILHSYLEQIDPDYTYQPMDRTPIPEILASARKRSHTSSTNQNVLTLLSQQPKQLNKPKKHRSSTQRRRDQDEEDDDDKSSNNNVLLSFDARMSTLLKVAAASQTKDSLADLHEISDSCSVTASEEPDHTFLL